MKWEQTYRSSVQGVNLRLLTFYAKPGFTQPKKDPNVTRGRVIISNSLHNPLLPPFLKSFHLDDVELDGLLLEERHVHVFRVVTTLHVAPHEHVVVLDDAAATQSGQTTSATAPYMVAVRFGTDKTRLQAHSLYTSRSDHPLKTQKKKQKKTDVPGIQDDDITVSIATTTYSSTTSTNN